MPVTRATTAKAEVHRLNVRVQILAKSIVGSNSSDMLDISPEK
jgi:hypothetical protein